MDSGFETQHNKNSAGCRPTGQAGAAHGLQTLTWIKWGEMQSRLLSCTSLAQCSLRPVPSAAPCAAQTWHSHDHGPQQLPESCVSEQGGLCSLKPGENDILPPADQRGRNPALGAETRSVGSAQDRRQQEVQPVITRSLCSSSAFSERVFVVHPFLGDSTINICPRKDKELIESIITNERMR